ncbi:WD repeat-containing protein 3 isoform X1 [Solea solea]|uniref:WD repeat-containing protein 3 isoform X1 n=1 Tax=Solea solea TaxID=90069 RepID=UPI00272B2033|nr:WD repeat-containing protein 3 isoform X1 [Solea solea]XP_058479074.1 WD repeat-containing protein 3 isoform X1 [Solea solea]XP_058479075.1 WD repeat-containing protein 3 isoform X1 [Solea solea]
MGLTKQYLRYVSSAVFGVIGSQKANIAYVNLRGERGRYVAVAACEHVFIWDVRKGEKVLILQGQKHEVTFLCPSPDGVHIAVGYEDGAVRIFSLMNGESNVSFNGHKSAVSVMNYDGLGARLVTGSKDTDVIVWDIINECGLYRLKGHKDFISQALFLTDKNLLVTSSKDSFVKWWDLDTQHCFKTIVGHRSEVWGMVLLNQENRLLTGSADSELRAWDIDYLQEEKAAGEPKVKKGKTLLDDDDDDDGDEEEGDESIEERILSCKKSGSILREARDRVVSLTTDAKARVIACHGNDSVLELFTVLTEGEVRRKMTKKTKKAKKMAAKRAQDTGEEEPEDPVVEKMLKDEIVRLTNLRASAKIRWVDCMTCAGNELKVALLLQNNTIETYTLKMADKAPAASKTARLTLGGHRTDARTLAFSSDNLAVLSASGDTVKVWNRATLQVIRTMACEYALCSLFVPGDRQIILGTKSGKLQIFELASGSLLETVEAHDGALWSLCLAPDQRGIMTGSADKTVKFWEFELIKDNESVQNLQYLNLCRRRLTVKHMRTLQLEEDVLCVKFSPDHRLLAVSLLDCTVKVFYTDTLKFFLSLYGHKLPVLCLDISHDNTLIATGSADRNVKIWGLDFGDCHRSMFAHDDSVMFLQFVPKTHLFFTAGKDKKIKQWDADKFEHIQTLEGHHREVWCLAISPSGDHIVSSSHDKSLRLWERTREPIILEEEREMEREAEFEESMAKGDVPVVPGETPGETAPAGKKTVETVKAAERIMEALELYKDELRKKEEHKYACMHAGKELPPPKPNPILVAFGNITPARYILDVIKKVRSSELEISLLVLPFPYVPELLQLFNGYIQQGLEVELVCRCLFFLLKIHFGQISSNQMMLSVIDELRSNTLSKVQGIRDMMGFNSAALQFLQREIESKEDVMFFAEATGRLKEKKRRRRKRERVVLTLIA